VGNNALITAECLSVCLSVRDYKTKTIDCSKMTTVASPDFGRGGHTYASGSRGGLTWDMQSRPETFLQGGLN